ncbi:MAG: hypothetical protein HQK86_06350 [Nitrospinae bacterium]|nr:hypothetical protein [Nitrospinota bacterium]MBF0634237.1 hypothetical protein [Nitrospinota bacterium]
MASYRDLSDLKSQEAYEKLLRLFEKKKVDFGGKTIEANMAGSALADYLFEHAKSGRV